MPPLTLRQVNGASGLPAGTAQALGALDALRAAGLGTREEFYWVLHATLVTRREHSVVFDAAFELFWRKPGLMEKMMAMLLPESPVPPTPEKPKAAALRVAEALGGNKRKPPPREDKVEIDARLTMSDQEILKSKDFEQMSADEIALVARKVRELVLPCDEVRTRRFRASPRGAKIDPRATLRRTLRTGGDVIALARRAPRHRHPPLVALIDISGSMSSYSRVMMHFMHALTQARPRVHTFLFGTRLSNITRSLAARDPDEALERVGQRVLDWSGGTRIGSSLKEFNKVWSRRVLGQGAVVLLVTDGLEREGGGELARQMERLAKSCRRLIWLNPLLRFDGFEPRAAGVRAMLPHVDEFRSVHNLESVESLIEALDGGRAAPAPPREWLAGLRESA
jgi:hypothetical protein